MRPFLFSALISGLRSRSFLMIFLLGLLLVGAAHLAAMFSPRQPQTVALDVGLSGMRFTLVLLALFWVQELVSKEIERRTVVLMLAYPIPRSRYVLGRFFGIALLLALAVLVLGLLLWIVVFYSEQGYASARVVALGLPYWATLLGVYLDVLVVTAFALCLSLLSTVLLLPLALGAVFAIIGRSIGAVVDFLVVRRGDGDQDMTAHFGPAIDFLRWVLPDLSRLDWRDWTLYQIAPDFASLIWSAVMAISFIVLLLSIGTMVFNRREFV